MSARSKLAEGDEPLVAEESLGKPQKAYVAFAFAAADLLMETDTDGRIIFAIGAAMSLVGRPARLLSTLTVADLVRPQDRSRTTNALKRMATGNRVRHVLVQVVTPEDVVVPVALCGYPHPETPDRLLLVLTHSGALMPTARRRKENGLLGKDDFEAIAETAMKESASGSGEEYQLTLLDIPEINNLRNKIGVEAAADFVSHFTEYLKQSSVGGDAAADLGNSKYGLIHGPEINAADIENTISDLARSLTHGDSGLNAQSTSVPLDASGISSEEATSALIYTINRFTADGGGAGSIHDLTKATRPRLSETVTKMREVKRVIGAGEFELYFQPIVDLWSNAVHHFEALVRFGAGGQSPYTTVTFAEDTGMVGELDMAILNRAIAFMRSGIGSEKSLKFAVNLSGRSITNSSTAARLLHTLANTADLRGRLLFEVTESAEINDLEVANAVVQEIRGRGFLVGLDDFGAGSAAFHYLRALKVDHVKIDGSYVRDATSANNDSMPFLRAIAQLCRELKVATIAEHIEDEATANLLRVFNVRYGQGYYFGKPMLPPRDQPSVRKAWATPLCQWRNDLLFFAPKGLAPAKQAVEAT